MIKRVLKVRDVDVSARLHPSYDGSLCYVLHAYLAEDDDVRGWPAGTFIHTSMILEKTDGLNIGSFIETMNTIYEVVD